MDLNADNWPYKWFGLWKEYGERYKNYPSIYTFVNEDVNVSYEKEKLIHYLKNGFSVVATSRRNFPNPFNGHTYGGSICFQTDGKWLWFSDLSEYVEQNHVVIPTAWYDEIKKIDFNLPLITHIEDDELDWPAL